MLLFYLQSLNTQNVSRPSHCTGNLDSTKLFDTTSPGAHLSLNRYSISRSLHAPQAPSNALCLTQSIVPAFDPRVQLCSTVRIKVTRRFKEAVRLRVTRGTEVWELCKVRKSCFAQRTSESAQTSELHLVCCPWRVLRSCGVVCGACFAHDELVSHRLDVHRDVPLPNTELFCVPFVW